MKKRKLAAGALIMAIAVLCAGCKRDQSPDEYLKSQIKKQTSDKAVCTQLMKTELETLEMTDFPVELQEAYGSFLKEAYAHIDYEVGKVKETSKNQYTVQVTVKPLDVSATVASIDSNYVKHIQSTDITTETKELMALAQEEFVHAKYESEAKLQVRMSWTDKKYQIDEDDMQNLLNVAVVNKMGVYEDIADVFDIRDYVQACLDFDYKGEFEAYIEQTQTPPEEAEQQYESYFWDTEMEGLGFTEEEKARCIAALKKIGQNTKYEIGTAKKPEESHYTVDVTGTANLSMQKVSQDLNAEIDSGAIGDEAQLRTRYMEILEAYAAAPVYGDPVSMTLNVVIGEDNKYQIEDADYTNFGKLLLPE